MSSPWSKISSLSHVNLQDIMLEEVTKTKLTETHRETTVKKYSTEECDNNQFLREIEQICDQKSNAQISQLLQQESDESLNKSVDLNKSPAFVNTSDYECKFENRDESEQFQDHAYWNQSEAAIVAITKHDVVVKSTNHTCLETAKIHAKLLNNSMVKLSSTDDQAAFDYYFNDGHRMKDEADNKMQILQLINKQIIRKVNCIVSVGKNSVVLHAQIGGRFKLRFKECILKVFGDTRWFYRVPGNFYYYYFGYNGLIHHSSALTEMTNLLQLNNKVDFVPKAIALEQNILILSVIGENGCFPTKLKHATLSYEEYISAYKQVVAIITNLYSLGNLIHANLSEDSILWYNKQCYCVDFSQAVKPCTIKNFDCLKADCVKVTNFFTRKQVPDVPTSNELFTQVTGFDYNSAASIKNAVNRSLRGRRKKERNA